MLLPFVVPLTLIVAVPPVTLVATIFVIIALCIVVIVPLEVLPQDDVCEKVFSELTIVPVVES